MAIVHQKMKPIWDLKSILLLIFMAPLQQPIPLSESSLYTQDT